MVPVDFRRIRGDALRQAAAGLRPAARKGMQSMKPEKNSAAWLPMFLCWLAYTAAYLGRYSYNSNITAIIEHFGVSHADAGLVTTCFFFAYGAGQVVNGILCRRYSRKWVVPFSLACSAGLNLAVFLGAGFGWLKYLWLLNGMAQSMLWPTLIYTLSQTLDAADLSKSVVVMSTTVPVGTLAAYGISAFLTVSGGYRYSFLTGAITALGAAAAWLLLYRRAFRAGGQGGAAVRESVQGGGGGSFLALTVVMLGIFAIINNLVKDGLTTWVPSILKEKYGLHQGLSILMTLVLPLLGLFGAACNTLLNRKVRSFLSLTGLWYLAAVFCMAAVVFLDQGWGVMLAAFGVVSLAMYAVNNVITSMAPLFMREQINSGLLAGILNGCCYVGSTVSSYGLGSVADRFGWNGVFLLLLGVSCVPVVLAGIAGLAFRDKLK